MKEERGKAMVRTILALSAILFAWAFFGLFVAFACNGGAAGSATEFRSEMWFCLTIYTIVFFMPFVVKSKAPDVSGEAAADSFECDTPVERDAESIKLDGQTIDFSDKYQAKIQIPIAILAITALLVYMLGGFLST